MWRIRRLMAVMIVATTSLTAQAGSEGKRWYRYYDEHHMPTITDSVTSEHISHGYEILNSSLQVIQTVPPPLDKLKVESERHQREQEMQRSRDDQKLLQLYSGPADAERSQKSQVDALQIRIDFLTGSLNRYRQQRTADAERAANIERSGRSIPQDLKVAIQKDDEQILSLDQDIRSKHQEMDQIKTNFAVIIKRLQELQASKASQTTLTP